MTTAYEDTGEFVAAVGRLADPLSDPLPAASPPGAEWIPQPESEPDGSSRARPAGQPWKPEPEACEPYESHQYATTYAAPATPTYPADADDQPHQQPLDESWQRGTRQRHGQGHGAYPQPYVPAPVHEPEPQLERQPQPQPGPGPLPDPASAVVPVPRRARAGIAQTAQLPVVEPEPGPGSGPAPEKPQQRQPPVPEGRAARRKAAKRDRGRQAAGTRSATVAPAAADSIAPRTRMEARRVARAAKDPPMVVTCRVTGELFITIGVLMLLFVIYSLWYTNILADEAANGATNSLKHQWAGASATSDANMPNHFAAGQTFAIIYLPKLDVESPIAEGIDKDTILDKGEVGHYSGSLETAFPWDKTGNFALAAHRNTHGEPFRYINRLVPGDKVVVETSSMYYTYEITSTLPQTSPSNVSVIRPVPPGSGFTKPGRYITLTTCTPEFTSLYRLIVWGKMVGEQPRSKGAPAALAG